MVMTMAGQLLDGETPGAGYHKDLAKVELDVSLLQERCRDHPNDLQARVRLSYRMFHRASLTGVILQLDETNEVLLEAIQQFGPKEDLCLLKANLDFHLHRLADVESDLDMAPLLSGRFEARSILADLAFQHGRYETARATLEQLIVENPTWDTIARLAHWTSKLGDIDESDQLYVRAEDELTAKQMLSFAWLELQRGMLDFNRGRYEEARTHYRRAEASYPGHWNTQLHFAELFAAEGDFTQAETLLKDVVVRTQKPELQHVLGDLYLFTDRPKEAEPWLDKALKAYLDSVQCGGVHYLHHLADFFSEARPEPHQALEWAQKDFDMRSNYATQSTLSWAYFSNQQVEEAVEHMRLALQSGVRDCIIFSSASEIYGAAGDVEQSKRFANLALQLNPNYRCFRIHH